MSGEVPTSTATVARAAFQHGNPYLCLRNRLGTIFTDAQFAPLFAHRGQPAECPWRSALVTLLQFAENLSDSRRHADPAWVERYSRLASDYDVPQGEAKRRAHAEQIGRDGDQVLAAITAPDARHGCARCRLLSFCGSFGCRISVSPTRLRP
ncbi:hypothetical protein ACFQY9_16915 [Microvirga aerilata]|uniref:hypothetical protein n=1 Tax=Microvirga aerilata TaxID=670292 RepID=UPI001FE451ED|nr:hypothetical protein [Microvirga aerilata]